LERVCVRGTCKETSFDLLGPVLRSGVRGLALKKGVRERERERARASFIRNCPRTPCYEA
jgi:hypothetical protein